MQTEKAPKALRKRSSGARLSPRELRLLADKLVAATDPAEISRLKAEMERGFYGDPDHAKSSA